MWDNFVECVVSPVYRTPRVELHYEVFSAKIGDLLSKYMHDEDCKFGLRVKNKRGDKWISYGDDYLLRNGSQNNYRLVLETVQKSVGQVYEAFQNPNATINSNNVTNLIPFVDPDAENNTPLFHVKSGKLHVREKLSDLQSKGTSSSWTGIGRVLKLLTSLSYQPKNSAINQTLSKAL